MFTAINSSIQLVGFGLIGGAAALLVVPALIGHARKGDLLAARTAMQALVPLWREEEGKVIWSNPAYDALARNGHPFAGTEERQRCGSDWYRVQRTGSAAQAVPINALVLAEAGLQQMVQTMARTFAHLPIGLAVFDKDRHLQMFNPALADLTTLAPEFLSRKPSLVAILDAMRNRNMVPEPKDWKDWRGQIVQMELDAVNGLYEETWSLPGGQTYRVTGRPHLDGGLALMIDDISTETIRSRRYRSDLELCQAVIDTMEEGIAVFSLSGQLVMSNAAYGTLWGHDPASSLSAIDIRHIAQFWRERTAPASIWTEAEEYISTVGTRTAWEGEARLSDGRLVICRFAPLAEGATLAGFRFVPSAGSPRALAVRG